MRRLTATTIMLIFLFSCDRPEKKNFNVLVFIDLMHDKSVSYKVTASDTLFREIKSHRLVEYCYGILTKSEAKQLNELVAHLKRGDTAFAIGPDRAVLFIVSNNGNIYYTEGNRGRNEGFYEVANWLRNLQLKTALKTNFSNKTFWNIDGINEPPPPPNQTDAP